MPAAPIPEDEEARLNALRACRILDTPDEQRFDDLTALAASFAETPIALVSLVDEQRQWFKSRVGLEARETPRDQAFCAHAILSPESPLVVPDATKDPRFLDNPLVTGEPAIRFYAGTPLLDDQDQALGTLCIIDTVPRTLTPTQLNTLEILGRQVSAQIQLTQLVGKLHKQNQIQASNYKRMVEYKSRLEESVIELERITTTDSLTSLSNRRAFNQNLLLEFDRSRRYKHSVSLIMLDIDHFKHINDRYGHPVGDEVLEIFGKLLRQDQRMSDVCARYGGEEFALILPNTSSEQAHTLAERLRECIQAHNWPCGEITASLGVTSLRDDDTHISLLSRADRALYAAKSAGRNCVVVY